MQVKPGGTLYPISTTCDPATGQGLDPSLIVWKFYRNGSRDTSIQFGSNLDDGDGITKTSVVVPLTYTEGDQIKILETTTVGGITASRENMEAIVVAKFPGELATAAAIAALGTPMPATARPLGDYPASITYNANNDISSVLWHGGKRWTYAYDGNSRLVEVTEA